MTEQISRINPNHHHDIREFSWKTRGEDETDLVLVSDRGPINVHQAVLVPSSQLLAELLPSSSCPCTKPAIILPAFAHHVLEAALELLYVGRTTLMGSREDTQSVKEVLFLLQIDLNFNETVDDTNNFLKSFGEPELDVNSGAFLKSLGGASGGGDGVNESVDLDDDGGDESVNQENDVVNESVDQDNSFLAMLNHREGSPKTAVNTKENRGKSRAEGFASLSRTIVGQVDMSRTMIGDDLDVTEDGHDSMTGGFDGDMDVTGALSMACMDGGAEVTSHGGGMDMTCRDGGMEITGENILLETENAVDDGSYANTNEDDKPAAKEADYAGSRESDVKEKDDAGSRETDAKETAKVGSDTESTNTVVAASKRHPGPRKLIMPKPTRKTPSANGPENPSTYVMETPTSTSDCRSVQCNTCPRCRIEETPSPTSTRKETLSPTIYQREESTSTPVTRNKKAPSSTRMRLKRKAKTLNNNVTSPDDKPAPSMSSEPIEKKLCKNKKSTNVAIDTETGHGDMKISDDMADSCKTICKICHEEVSLAYMRVHTRKKHELQISAYKAKYGNFVILEEVHHKCHLCKNIFLLDYDNLNNHITSCHKKWSFKEYTAHYMTLIYNK